MYTANKHQKKKKSKNVTTLSHSSFWIPLSIVCQFNAPLGTKTKYPDLKQRCIQVHLTNRNN
jgi:hypothetical protein